MTAHTTAPCPCPRAHGSAAARRAGGAPSALDHLAARLTMLGSLEEQALSSLANDPSQAASDAAASLGGAATNAAAGVQAATDAATQAVKSDGGGGFFGPFAWAFESSLKVHARSPRQDACQHSVICICLS